MKKYYDKYSRNPLPQLASSHPQYFWSMCFYNFTFHRFWVGQKVCSGFSIRSYGKKTKTFLTNSLFSTIYNNTCALKIPMHGITWNIVILISFKNVFMPSTYFHFFFTSFPSFPSIPWLEQFLLFPLYFCWLRNYTDNLSLKGYLYVQRILEWVVMPSSRGSSQHGDQTCISCISCIGR